MLLTNEVSIARKARELILAVRIEQSLSKDRILELYLNEIYLGLQAYGVAAAAQAYFGKSLDELTLPEAAFLAALPKAPNNYNPFRFPDAARTRRDWVLDRMADDRVITQAQAAEAKTSPVLAAKFRRPETVMGGEYFAEEVRRQLIDRFGAERTTQGGLVVRSTLDPTLQAAADRTLRDGLMRYDQRHGGWRGPIARMSTGPNLRTGWAVALANVRHPPGMLHDWRLAVVLEATDSQASLGYLEPVPGGTQPRLAPMQLSDLTWARPRNGAELGPTPRRISDVIKIGDIVMVEPGTGTATKASPSTQRLLLRQIPQVQGALVTVETQTGRVLALSGGWSFETSQFNRATQAMRQPGSSFKPLVYLTALQQDISPSQKVLDGPFEMDNGTGGKWRPGNYGLTFSGPTPMRIALERSLNLVTIRLANQVGMAAVANTASIFHVSENMPRVLPASLGAVETTVLRLTGAYASFASGGREVVPTLIDSVQDSVGHTLWKPQLPTCDNCQSASQPPNLVDGRKQVADPQSVFQLVTMMQGVVQRGTGTAAGAGLNRAIAGKTGTTQDFNDAWFVGFTPDLATGIWVGFDETKSLGDKETGSSVVAPIWHDYMAVALKNRPNLKFTQPPNVTLASWDSGSGTVTDAFKNGQTPGASNGTIGGGDVSADSTTDPRNHAAGVDTGLGGLY